MTENEVRLAEIFLSAIDKIDPFSRDDYDMSPQQFRRWRVWQGLKAVIAKIEPKETP